MPNHTGHGMAIAAGGYIPTFLQQHLTVIFPYLQKSHTSPSSHSVPNICKKLKLTRALYILQKLMTKKIPNSQAILTEVNPLVSVEPIDVLLMWCTFRLQELRRKLYQNRLLIHILWGTLKVVFLANSLIFFWLKF